MKAIFIENKGVKDATDHVRIVCKPMEAFKWLASARIVKKDIFLLCNIAKAAKSKIAWDAKKKESVKNVSSIIIWLLFKMQPKFV